MDATLVKRVENLETEMIGLKANVLRKQPDRDWRSTFGMSPDDPGFEEMIRLGREIRASQRGVDGTGAGSGH